MSEDGNDLPTDVRDTLVQLFVESRRALTAGDPGTAESAVESAETVVTNEVPAGPLRERLLFGCTAVTDLLADGVDGEDRAVAAEYLAAMERRLGD